jgi:UDP-glucose 4-epimerase
MKALVTGGAGFIGSHLTDRLLELGYRVTCVDNLSLGTRGNLQKAFKNQSFQFIQCDVSNAGVLESVISTSESPDVIFHLAANSDIAAARINPGIDFTNTLLTTQRVLEYAAARDVRKIVFSSTSAVYGSLGGALAEDSGPLLPISHYGAAKLASEALISAHCEYRDLQAWICRFPNVVGERTTHGIIHDFIAKLERDPHTLEVLGDGKQHKPYLYVHDLVSGILHCFDNARERRNLYNLGVDDDVTVTRIANIVIDEMGLPDVSIAYTGGERGWVGDVPTFKYDLSKVHALGWRSERTSEDAIRLAARAELDRRAMRYNCGERDDG